MFRDQRLSRVCVSLGPGGYTGLRVSVTVAKSIAHATGASLVGVPSATVAVGDDRPSAPFCVCLASKGTRTHVTAFDDPDQIDGEPVGVLDAEGLVEWHRARSSGNSPELGEIILVADRFCRNRSAPHAYRGPGEFSPRGSPRRVACTRVTAERRPIRSDSCPSTPESPRPSGFGVTGRVETPEVLATPRLRRDLCLDIIACGTPKYVPPTRLSWVYFPLNSGGICKA